jgi:hypothetical protein
MGQNVGLYLATPYRSAAGLSIHYHFSILELVSVANGKSVQVGGDFVDALFPNLVEIQSINFSALQAGLCDVRARLVRTFHEAETKPGWLLFVDDDMGFKARTVLNMLTLATEKKLDVLGALYHHKKYDDEALAEAAGDPNKRASLRKHGFSRETMVVAVEKAYDPTDIPAAYSRVSGVGMGLTLISRACLDKMIDAYREELGERDLELGGETVQLFAKYRFPKERRSVAEDLSFCRRWEDLGGAVHLYHGPGTPLLHHGLHAFEPASI